MCPEKYNNKKKKKKKGRRKKKKKKKRYEVPSIRFQTFFRLGTFIDSTHMKL